MRSLPVGRLAGRPDLGFGVAEFLLTLDHLEGTHVEETSFGSSSFRFDETRRTSSFFRHDIYIFYGLNKKVKRMINEPEKQFLSEFFNTIAKDDVIDK